MKAVQYFNLTDLHTLYSLTPRTWMNWVRGYQHKQLDRQEESVNSAVHFAMANNGKSLNSVLRKIKNERDKIDLDEIELERRREEKRLLRELQRKELDQWTKQISSTDWDEKINKEG